MDSQTLASDMGRIFKHMIQITLRIYKKAVSPYIPMACRFYPSCSHYAYEALEHHGLRAGLWLAIKRLGRCHPFGGSGIDFVPVPNYLKDESKS